jgi:DNA-binding transcriptional MocR family regulator
VPTVGVHASAMAVIAAMTSPGDKIAFEQLTYSSISRSANLIGRRSVVVGVDEQGPIPEDFDRLCAQQHPKLAFFIPSLHNPTLTITPVSRRREIADIARKHNVWLMEDSIYGAMLDQPPTPISAFLPERTFHIGGLSKTVSAGVRGGWVSCPANLAPRIQIAHKMITGGLPFMLAELSSRMVLSGAADTIRQAARVEIEAREAIARRAFSGLDFISNKRAPFLWMKLPDPWLSGTFKQAAASEGVVVDDEDEYKPGRTEHFYHRIRVGFTTPKRREDIHTGFTILRRLIDNPNAGYDSYG